MMMIRYSARTFFWVVDSQSSGESMSLDCMIKSQQGNAQKMKREQIIRSIIPDIWCSVFLQVMLHLINKG